MERSSKMKKLLLILEVFAIFAAAIIFVPSANAIGTLYTVSSQNGDVACGTSGYFTVANNMVMGNTDCIGSVTIPSGVGGIFQSAFEQSTNNQYRITSISIANSVTTIYPRAFAFNRGLTSLNLGSGVTTIGTTAFMDSYSLTTVTMPSSLRSISQNAFRGSVGLVTLVLNPELTTIGSGSFLGIGATSYTYCGSLSQTTLNSAGLNDKTKLCTPEAPTSVSAISTGPTTASVSFTAPSPNGGSTITSYTATSSPGGITGTVSQAGSGTIAMAGLTPGTTYTFTVKARNASGDSRASSPSNLALTVGPPSAPNSIVATTTGKRSAKVSFSAPASDGGSSVISYTVTSAPGGFTTTLVQAAGGTLVFENLEPSTNYVFTISATNAIGRSAEATSNSIKTDALIPASLSAITFTDDGTGTGGKISWLGNSVDSVLYTGPANSYPSPYNYGAFTGGWNGAIRNLTPDTEYTISIFAISTDGIGESKSLTFKTGEGLLANSGNTKSLSVQTATSKLSQMITWVNQNTFVPGEAANINRLLTKFDSLVTSSHRSFIKVPTSRVSKVEAKSLTPLACSVVSTTAKVDAGMVKALTKDTCTIAYTVSGPSKAPATMVKDFVFKKVG
jgi:hypothetical protein